MTDPITQYAHDVCADKYVTGRLVKLACQRHLDDLADQKHRELVWRPDEAQLAIDFFPECLLLDNDEPFLLHPSQQFIVGSLFGWYNADGSRRFRTAYVELGKGNGKSPIAAGIGLYGLIADSENAAEIYSAAVKRDQAKIVFDDAKRMAETSPLLREVVETGMNNLAHLESYSFFRPISSEAKSLDGLRVHMALIDEVHEHPSGAVIQKLRAGTKGRENALIFEITNSGYDRHSICWQHHDYSAKVLAGILQNDSWFAYVCNLDPCQACLDEGRWQPKDDCTACDDWRDEAVWVKANPLLDVSISRRYLRERVAEAQDMPAESNLVKRLNFCIWTEQHTRWLPMDKWDECDFHVLPPGPLDTIRERLPALIGRKCFAGLDLASTIDIAALVLFFPAEADDEAAEILPFFWVPADSIPLRKKQDGIDYQPWVDQGWLMTTEGNICDYDVIRAFIAADDTGLTSYFSIEELAIDRWNSTQLQTQLTGDGITVVPFGQGYASMSAPTKELLTLILGKKINHGGNPVLRWMASNVSVKQDPAGNLKPDKEKSSEKIDGIVSLIMALGRAIVHTPPPASVSVYETRGLTRLGAEEE